MRRGAKYTFTILATDASGNTMTIDVTSVNDAPAGTDNTITTNEDTGKPYTAALNDEDKVEDVRSLVGATANPENPEEVSEITIAAAKRGSRASTQCPSRITRAPTARRAVFAP